MQAEASGWSTDVYTMCTLGIVSRPTHYLRFNREWVCQCRSTTDPFSEI